MTSHTNVTCPSVLGQDYEILKDRFSMLLYKHSISYCDQPHLSESFYTYPIPENELVELRKQWLKQYPSKRFYQTRWGIHQGLNLLLYDMLMFGLTSFVVLVHALLLEKRQKKPVHAR